MSESDLLGGVFEALDFRDEDARALAAIGPELRGSFDQIVDEFHQAIARAPRAMAVFTEGREQIERQKASLRGWLTTLFGGVYDEAYLQRRARVAEVHVRLHLEQRYLVGAMTVVSRGLHRALEEARVEEDLRRRGHAAIERIIGVELAVLLETYHQCYAEQQREQERLANLGQLAASIGHELRNPLAVMSTSAHLLRRRAGRDEKILRHVDKIVRQIGVSERIIGDLLALAGDRHPRREWVDLVALVEDVREALPTSDEIRVRAELDEGVRSIWVDGGQLRQVLMNLLTNAMQAVEAHGGGEVEVRARLLDGGDLEVTVLDDGPGFPDGSHERAFEPLFTTKPEGVGLGLALCARIVEKHGGTIHARDRDEGGAMVCLRLPATKEVGR